MEFQRKELVSQLCETAWDGNVKVITGPRRSGKSYLLSTLYRRHLEESGVDPKAIISLALDSLEGKPFQDIDKAYGYINDRTSDPSKKYYVFIDEVQMMADFEYLMNSLLRRDNVDVYVTGSNSRFLSSDIVTEFRGRDSQISVCPLTYKEILQAVGKNRNPDLWKDYLIYGGLPKVVLTSLERQKQKLLQNYFVNTYVKDIIGRYHGISSEYLGMITRMVASDVGSLTNPLRISRMFKSRLKAQVSQEEISKCLDALANSFLVTSIGEQDVRGSRFIGERNKYYFEDLGIRNAALDFSEAGETQKLVENAIYCELKSRGLKVSAGFVPDDGKEKGQGYEVDFVASGIGWKTYIQVALDVDRPEKMRQEKNSLLRIPNAFQKVLVSGSALVPFFDEDGILQVGFEDFMTNPGLIQNPIVKARGGDMEM